jgi:hypothetical protein
VLRPRLVGSPRPPTKVSSASKKPLSGRAGSYVGNFVDGDIDILRLDGDALTKIGSVTLSGHPASDMLSVFAEFETNLRRERQLEGISAAKARGVYKGRKPSIDAVEVLRLRRDEKLGPAAIARRLGIGRASVYRLFSRQAAVSAKGGVDADPA